MFSSFKVDNLTQINESTARFLGDISFDFICTNLVTANAIGEEKIVQLKLKGTYIAQTFRFIKNNKPVIEELK